MPLPLWAGASHLNGFWVWHKLFALALKDPSADTADTGIGTQASVGRFKLALGMALTPY